MSVPWIVVVEDEPLMGDLIVENLRLEGYGAELIRDGDRALARLRSGPCDLVVLDIMLPGQSGFDVLDAIRKDGNRVPVLILSARAEDEHRVRGLKLGADDYVGKPFNLTEFLLRVAALLRRVGARSAIDAEDRLSFGGNDIDLTTHEAKTLSGEEHHLTKTEAMLLRYLSANPSRVITRKEILDTVWGVDAYPTPRTVDNFIARFRKLFEADAREPRHFLTLRGVGYRFEP